MAIAVESGSMQLLKVGDVAAAVRIFVPTVWRLVSLKKMPAPIHAGGSTRWRHSDLQRWIDAGCPVIEAQPGKPDGE
jgi:predicted DNA-binding transcriptional regulator AlpA